MEELVISRKVWLCGEGFLRSYLLRPSDGKMCCIGIYLRSRGLQPDDILGEAGPLSIRVHDVLPEDTQWLLDLQTDRALACNSLMAVNDDKTMTQAERERRIAELFAKQGIQVTFTD